MTAQFGGAMYNVYNVTGDYLHNPSRIKDYFMIDPKIKELEEEIEEIKHGNYGLPRMNVTFLNYIHSFAPDFLKPNADEINRSLARLNADIVKCKAKKVDLKTKLTKYYNSEISKLRQYL